MMQSNIIRQCFRGIVRVFPPNVGQSGLKTMTTSQRLAQRQQLGLGGATAPSSSPPDMATGGQAAKYLIVGLGNHDLPQTRHSVGMQVVDKLADYLHTSWVKEQKNCVGFVAKASISDDLQVVLLKPKMPMNVNGTSVSKTAQWYGIDPDHIYLIHDDIDKSLGKVNIKEQGSANGHNGVRSCMNSLRSDSMPRLRIGIDRPIKKEDVADYVLSEFSTKEQQVVSKVVDTCLVTIADHMAKRSGVELREALHLPKAEAKKIVTKTKGSRMMLCSTHEN